MQRPLSLINQRGLLRESIEQQKEVLRKSNYWHTIFSAKDKKRHIDQDKEKVIEVRKVKGGGFYLFYFSNTKVI